uniref:Uncharacterized protein n=1 Tax=Rousettus aegyptiacus TaxID=9407 RepID=A0A7J8F0Y9_ROUAE|nr:hypothetical protein HJG63_012426 [Rousettus aegyptiacus]
MTSGSFPRAFWADLKVNRLHLGPRPSLERNRRNTEGDQGPQELPDAPRCRASEVAAGLRARHRCLPHCAFAVLSNQVTAHTAAGFDLTCVFPGKLLAQNRHSWSRWSCERPGGLSESVLAESRGDHSYSTLRGGCPASREPSVSFVNIQLLPRNAVQRSIGQDSHKFVITISFCHGIRMILPCSGTTCFKMGQ